MINKIDFCENAIIETMCGRMIGLPSSHGAGLGPVNRGMIRQFNQGVGLSLIKHLYAAFSKHPK
jgi:hypothetical protein